MNSLEKAIVAYQEFGLLPLIGLTYRFLWARLLLNVGWLVPAFRDYGASKIFSYQSGDRDSMAAFSAYVSLLQSTRGDRPSLTTLVPNYLLPIFQKVEPLLPQRVVFDSYATSTLETPYDILLIQRGMAGSIAGLLKTYGVHSAPVFENNDFFIVATPALLETRPGEGETATSGDRDRLMTFIEGLPEDTVPPGTTVLSEKRGFTFEVRAQTMDDGILDEVYHAYVEWLADKLSGDRTIVDIGAHIGAFSIQVTSLLDSTARLLAFEPEPSNFRLLTQNVDRNQLPQIHCFNQAVSNKPGNARLYLSSDNTGGHRLHLPDPSAQQCVDVEVVTLPQILAMSGPIDVLKVDVEGSEHNVLMPFGEHLTQSVNYLIVEAGGSARGDGTTLLTFLTQLGFSCSHQGDPSLMLIRAINPRFVTH